MNSKQTFVLVTSRSATHKHAYRTHYFLHYFFISSPNPIKLSLIIKMILMSGNSIWFGEEKKILVVAIRSTGLVTNVRLTERHIFSTSLRKRKRALGQCRKLADNKTNAISGITLVFIACYYFFYCSFEFFFLKH